eukprot:TRINITY_DN1591_c0_g2_i1.p1 TRINITY_DN1591_c0_g2~~TRINITY_DN1591_c0_g2_i1.p1  ORF type:complete len:166 (-),score=15.29 TRINITY_DN1591_c0_g2_i1:174-671(-)
MDDNLDTEFEMPVTFNDSTLKYKVKLSDTIESLLHKISQDIKEDMDEFYLETPVVGKKLTKRINTLRDHRMKQGEVYKAVKRTPTQTLYAKFSDGSHPPLTVGYDYQDRVRYFKKKVAEQWEIPNAELTELHVIFAGKWLEEDRRLVDYGVQKESTLTFCKVKKQ